MEPQPINQKKRSDKNRFLTPRILPFRTMLPSFTIAGCKRPCEFVDAAGERALTAKMSISTARKGSNL